VTEERASPQRLETVQAVQKVQTVQNVEGHEPNATKIGIVEGWNDAFNTQYSNIPLFQHPISSYAPMPARSDAHSSVYNSRAVFSVHK
jgi:hypothetical protein